MTRVGLFHCVGLVTAFCTFTAVAQGPALGQGAGTQPNVLILYSDDQNYATLGTESNGVVKTPNLDRMSREGVRFTRFAANHPVCTVSRATLQSGLYAPVHGATENNILMDPPHTTYLAEVFERAGYATGYAGKWHIDGGTDKFGNPALFFRPRDLSYVQPGDRRRGYQEFLGYECCPISNQPFFWQDVITPEAVYPPIFTPVPEFGWEPQFQRAALRDFVQRHVAAQEPWMYQISFAAPHVPLMAPQEYLDLYDPNTLPLPPWTPANLTPDQQAYARSILRPYYAMVSHIDAEIGKIMDDLEALGQTNNTLIVFASDNGDFLGSHWGDVFNFVPDLYQGKGLPLVNAFRVPLIMRWPTHIPAGKEVNALMGMVDMAPTILSLADLPVPWRMQGTNMSEWALGNTGPVQPALWVSLTKILQPSFIAVWDGDTVLSEWGVRHLFDLKNDPYETTNLIDRPEAADTQQRLETLLNSLTVQAYTPPAFPDIGAAADEADAEAVEFANTVSAARGAGSAVIDGMPIRAHIRLALAVGRGKGDDTILRDAILSAYAQNLDAFDRNDFQRARRFRALLTVGLSANTALRQHMLDTFATRDGVPLGGTYNSVFCETAGACFPTDPFTPLPGPPLGRQDTRAIEEPLAGSGDADMDGISNAQEYANAVAAGTGMEGFLKAALDPKLNGTETTGTTKTGSGSCFIATAAYGTPLAVELDTLRGFRDRWLLNNAAGAAFTDTYYRLSPDAAEWIAPRPFARAIARTVLSVPMTAEGRLIGSAGLLALALVFLTRMGRRRAC